MCLADLVDGGSRSNHARKEGSSRKVREETRDEGSGISHEGSHHKHASGLRTDVGNGRCHESQNDERDDESQEFTEDAIEGHEDAHHHFG